MLFIFPPLFWCYIWLCPFLFYFIPSTFLFLFLVLHCSLFLPGCYLGWAFRFLYVEGKKQTGRLAWFLFLVFFSFLGSSVVCVPAV